MDSIRNNPPRQLGSLKVLKFRDYKLNKIVNIETNEVTETGLPESNVLYFELENDAWCCVRPSGTEPKIKFYMGVKGNSMEDADKQLATLKKEMNKIANV